MLHSPRDRPASWSTYSRPLLFHLTSILDRAHEPLPLIVDRLNSKRDSTFISSLMLWDVLISNINHKRKRSVFWLQLFLWLTALHNELNLAHGEDHYTALGSDPVVHILDQCDNSFSLLQIVEGDGLTTKVAEVFARTVQISNVFRVVAPWTPSPHPEAVIIVSRQFDAIHSNHTL